MFRHDPDAYRARRSAQLRAHVAQLIADQEETMPKSSVEYREVWDPTIPPGGFICATCGTPVESEPCPEHAPEEWEPVRHPCGHAGTVRGCGGCDPSAIDFVIEGGVTRPFDPRRDLTNVDGMFVAPDGGGRLSIWHERYPDDEAPLLCMAEPRPRDPARRVWDVVAAMLPRRA